MKDFTRPRGRLRSLPLAARVVYSVFAVFTLVGLGLTGWLASDMVGLDLAKMDAYYAGGSETLPGARGTTHGAGPQMELPPEAERVGANTEPMPLRKLLEVTHFHLFSIPVYLLILSHLFMLSRLNEGPKVAWIAMGTLATAAHIAAPWIVRAQASAAGAIYGSSGALMTLSFLVMSAVPLFEMWALAGREEA